MEDFDFPAAMRKARDGLEKLLVEYAAEHPEMGYRDLGDKFNLSLGAISKIMKRWKTLRRNTKSYKKHLRKLGGELAGLIEKKATQEAGNKNRPPLSRSASSGVPAAPVPAVPPSLTYSFEPEYVESALQTLDRCLAEEEATDVGEDSYQTLVQWLKRRQGSKARHDRAESLLRRYERLRQNA